MVISIMPSPPNILFITSDEQRYDTLGCTGNPVIRTPHLDALAHDGTVFHHAYVQQPLCVPSRVTALTGQYPLAHGVRDNRTTMRESDPPFPMLMARHAYQTAAIGKMHFVPPRQENGFQHLVLAEQAGRGIYEDEYHKYLDAHGLIDRFDLWDQQMDFRRDAPGEYWDSFSSRVSGIPEDHYSTTWIAGETIRFLRKQREEPFFIWMSFIKPHHPFDPPIGWENLYSPQEVPMPHGRDLLHPSQAQQAHWWFDWRKMSEAKLREIIVHYYGTISHIDHHVGRVLHTLRDLDLYDNTMIVYSSDHGDFLGDHGLVLKGKYLYDPLVRVPLIIKAPNRLGKGLQSNHLVEWTDLMPTFLEIAGIPVPASCQGRSLLPILHNREVPWRTAVFAEYHDLKMVRTHQWKLIHGHEAGGRCLFDVQEDPHELNNLHAHPDYRDTREAMTTMLLDKILAAEKPLA